MPDNIPSLKDLMIKLTELELQVEIMRRLFNSVPVKFPAEQVMPCEHENKDHKHHCLDCGKDFSADILADKIDAAMERRKYGED